MHRILSRPVTGVLISVAALAAASAASAAVAPPSVSVRIEGSGTTLLPQTPVQTEATKMLRGHVCPGSTAAGALTLATHSQWTGTYFKSFGDFEVTNILGETPAGSSDFWTLWINGRSSSTGACSTKLRSGDHELWFDCLGTATGACSNDPLALRVPAEVRRGHKVTVRVTQLDAGGHGTPVAGAAVNGGGVAAVTNAKGKATITTRAVGEISVQATKSGATPSDTAFVCVYPRRRSQCAAIRRDGPRTHVDGIRNGQVFTGHGPRVLHGTAGPDPLGLTDVRLTLLRRAPGGGCSYFDPGSGHWLTRGCQVAPVGSPFSIGPNTRWSYMLPRALAAGGYRLVIVAADAGARETRVRVGSSAVEFVVRS
jgi:hypothetical protein